MAFLQRWLLFAALWLTVASSEVEYIPLKAPSYPLAVKNPYFNAWLPGNSVRNLSMSRAEFWTGAKLTWSLLARVNGATYNIFGVESPESNTTSGTVVSAEYTASHTKFVVDAGDAQFLVDFLSPVNPKDYLRQSLPFSYLTVSVIGLLNGKPANVQIYSDIDDSWNGQNLEKYDQTSAWKLNNTGTSAVWQISHVGAKQYSQGGPDGDMALWGSVIYASNAGVSKNLTTAAGPRSNVRSAFVSHGCLSSLLANSSWAQGGVTGFAHELGIVDHPVAVTFALGYTRDCDLTYLGNCREGYYKSQYKDPISAALFVLDDYQLALEQSLNLDDIIKTQAITAGGQNYADIIALSTRQTFGGIDLTIPGDTLATNDCMAFIKEISSDGNVNTIDVIYPAFPQLYVLDVEYLRFLLEPVVSYLASGKWKLPYVIHDIGSNYPYANGHDDQKAEVMPIEETANLLILAWIYTSASGNTHWAAKYTPLFQGYADYLVVNGLYPTKQLSTDDFAGPVANSTNLAIKAAIGLTSFGSFANQTTYATIGHLFGRKIYNCGLGTDQGRTHFTLQYGDESSWGTTFNLFPDYLMKLGTFDPAAFEMQSSWYRTVRSGAGLALDSALDIAKTDWMMWAGTTSSADTLKMVVDDLHAYLGNGLNNVPFGDKYVVRGTDAGKINSFKARPVVGGEWSAMALQGSF